MAPTHRLVSTACCIFLPLLLLLGCLPRDEDHCGGPSGVGERYTVEQLDSVSQRCVDMYRADPPVVPLDEPNPELVKVERLELSLYIDSESHVETYSFPALRELGGDLTCWRSGSLRSVGVPSLEQVERIRAEGCSGWNQVQFPALLETESIDVDFPGDGELSVSANALGSLTQLNVSADNASAVALEFTSLDELTGTFAFQSALQVTAARASAVSVSFPALRSVLGFITIEGSQAEELNVSMPSLETLEGDLTIDAANATSVTLDLGALRSVLGFIAIEGSQAEELSVSLPSLETLEGDLTINASIASSVALDLGALRQLQGDIEIHAPLATSVELDLSAVEAWTGAFTEVEIDAPESDGFTLSLPSLSSALGPIRISLRVKGEVLLDATSLNVPSGLQIDVDIERASSVQIQLAGNQTCSVKPAANFFGLRGRNRCGRSIRPVKSLLCLEGRGGGAKAGRLESPPPMSLQGRR